MESARVDQWLWAIRLYKSRSASTEACRDGHVRTNGASAKPAAKVRPADRVEVRVHGRDRMFEVVNPIDKRLGAALAAACAVDLSPPAPSGEDAVATRERGSGRPTKRDRRRLDQFRR
ncbi:MAG: RNA-binding S4 domain-containing protein [Acidimicrobiales bacterium]